MFEPTQEQKAIIAAVASKQNLKIGAFAGTGKTTTLPEERLLKIKERLEISKNTGFLSKSRGSYWI